MADLTSLGSAGNPAAKIINDSKVTLKKGASLIDEVVQVINKSSSTCDLPENIAELEFFSIGCAMAKVDGNISQNEIDFLNDIAGTNFNVENAKQILDLTNGFTKPSPLYELLKSLDAATDSGFASGYLDMINIFIQCVALSDGNYDANERAKVEAYIKLCKNS